MNMRLLTWLDYLDSQLFCTRTRCLYACAVLVFMQGIIYCLSASIVHLYELSGSASLESTTSQHASPHALKTHNIRNHSFVDNIPDSHLNLPHRLMNISQKVRRNRKLLQRIQSIKKLNQRYKYVQLHNATLYDLMFLESIQYLPHYKNPCFIINKTITKDDTTHRKLTSNTNLHTGDIQYSNKGDLKCIPLLYVAGFTKCATTDLHARLTLHQHVTWGWTKEPHWWDNYHRADSTLVRYADMFTEATRRIKELTDSTSSHPVILGDFTPRTAWHGDDWTRDVLNGDLEEPRVLIPQRMRHILPQTRVIFLMRNPVDRLYSDYLDMMVRHNSHIRAPSPAHFHDHVVRAIEWWVHCIATHSERSCAYGYPRGMSALDSQFGQQWYDQAADRLRIGLYIIYLEEWLSVFAAENLLFLSFDTYTRHPRLVIQRSILPFLGLEPFSEGAMQSDQWLGSEEFLNSRRVRVSQDLDKPMLNITKSILHKFYKPYNQRLVDMLGNEFNFL